MNKREESSARLRYITAMGRFLNSVEKYLYHSEEIQKEAFIKKIKTLSEKLNKVPKTVVYKEEYKDMETLVQKVQTCSEDSSEEMGSLKETILHALNKLDQSKNRKKYKKNKHAHGLYREWE